MAPPPTRGSTRLVAGPVLVPLGSPAHAGIDPARSPSERHVVPAPPPTRGSTLGLQPGLKVALGSPAHAGIDPMCPLYPNTRPWLPRPRGDRPRTRRIARSAISAPPPTRGSTPHRLARLRLGSGSPAHAGIDPTRAAITTAARRLPRPRGDRPVDHLTPAASDAAPPPTRGSTPLRGELGPGVVGSPAHAGIDPSSVPRERPLRGLPRPRGDRPITLTPHDPEWWAPPPTRGSTRCQGAEAPRQLGSPAHAGIDPSRSARSPARSGAPPPTRGSTLRIDLRWHTGAGSPAHAGIDPHQPHHRPRLFWLPRPRGDRPAVR